LDDRKRLIRYPAWLALFFVVSSIAKASDVAITIFYIYICMKFQKHLQQFNVVIGNGLLYMVSYGPW